MSKLYINKYIYVLINSKEGNHNEKLSMYTLNLVLKTHFQITPRLKSKLWRKRGNGMIICIRFMKHFC